MVGMVLAVALAAVGTGYARAWHRRRRPVSRRALAALPLLLLAGCDLTDGGDGRGLSLGASAIELAADYDGPVPPARTVPIRITHPAAAEVVVGYRPDLPQPAWMSVGLVTIGDELHVEVQVTKTLLTPATFETVVRVGLLAADGAALATRDLQVRYVLSPALKASPAALTLTHVLGGTTAPKTVAVGGTPGVAWTASASQPWVALGSTTGATPGSLSVGVDAAGLGAGTYEAELTVTGAGRTVTVPISLEVRRPSLRVSEAALDFSGDNGATLEARTFDVVMDNGAEVAWTAYPGAGWIVLDRTSGTTPAQITVAVDASVGPLSAGTHSAPLILYASAGGAELDATVQVSLELRQPALVASQAALEFRGVDGAPLAKQTFEVSMDNGAAVEWTASPGAGWIVVDQSSGTTPAQITVEADPSVGALAVGTHEAPLTLAATFGWIELEAALPVSVELWQPSLVVSQPALAFAGVNGVPLATQTFDVSLDNEASVAWTAVPAAGWIVLGASSGTTPSRVTVAVDPSAGPLASGLHAAPVALSAAWRGSALEATVGVSASLATPTLSVPAAIVLGGADGRDLGARPLQLALGTGTNAHRWTASTRHAWISLPVASGSASATPTTLDVVPVASGLTGGTRTGSITISAAVNGDVVRATVPVTFNLEQNQLRASHQGVALTSTPGVSRLTRTLRVADSLGLGVPWSAASDQEWLSAAASGTTPGDLVLTADPAGLAADTLHLATVTIGSTDPSVEDETVRVGLWIGSTAPSASTRVAGAFTEVVADPVRPHVYAHEGGTSVSVYNVHTGAKVATLAGLGGELGSMAVSGDGSRLYVVDMTFREVVPVDLDTRIAGPRWSVVAPSNAYLRVSWMRTDGRPLLAVTDGTLRDPDGGAVLGTFWVSPFANRTRVTSSADGGTLCAPYCNGVSFTRVGGGVVTTGALHGALNELDGALSADGAVVYVTNASAYNWLGYSTATGQQVVELQSNKPYPGSVEVGWDGRIYAGRYSSYSGADVFVFDAAGAEVGSLRVVNVYPESLLAGALALSGDGLRVIGMGTVGFPPSAMYLVTLP